jgi:peptidoglycan/xylan/chitin deacetylase (PgdA/CDA1 family)
VPTVPDVLVLCYHAVSPTWDSPLSVTPDALESQIGYLLNRGWHPTTFRDAVAAPPARRTLAVTFDDAFASVRQYALPMFDRLGVPATVFAPTAYMTGGMSLAWPEINHWLETPDAGEVVAMDWSDLSEMAGRGWEIGSHSHSHAHLTQLDTDRLHAELEQSREECASHLGVACDSIAYPFGEVDERVANAARSIGYRAGASLSSRLPRYGPYRWPRVGVSHRDTERRFHLKANRSIRELRATRFWPL